MKLGLLLSIGCVGTATLSAACGWDNDTLAAESKGIPELLDALVGRIAIYPKEYYEFRIARSAKIVASDPSNLNELDNLIVAYDKLGDFSRAIASANLKLKALKAKPNKEHEYRYYANLGTIEVHEWLRRNDHTDKSLLDQSIKDLKKCIEINPDAHFGREIVQVKLVEMIRRSAASLTYPQKQDKSLDYPIPDGKNTDEWEKFVSETGSQKVQKGIIGIMSLGSGPDSPDLLCAILPTLPERSGVVREVALHRIDDLWSKKPIYSGIGYEMQFMRPAEKALFANQYAALVENTKLYRQSLSDFVRAKVAKGDHPDVNPHFWDDWREPKHVDLKSMEPTLRPAQKIELFAVGVICAGFLALFFIIK